jgi:hypothetical protein
MGYWAQQIMDMGHLLLPPSVNWFNLFTRDIDYSILSPLRKVLPDKKSNPYFS